MDANLPCLCTALRQAAADATRDYDAALAPSGLKVTMLRPLSIVEREPGVSISELGRRVGLDRSSMARNLKVLERGGHVRVRAGADERSRGVELTERGAAALAKARPLWREAQAAMAERLGGERETLLALLDTTRDGSAGAKEATSP